VGFVSSLPPELIAAFRATLLESREADLLLHVIDVADPFRSERRGEVESVLESIGAGDIPVILVYNKIDKADDAAGVHRDGAGRVDQVWLSAQDGHGVEALRQAVLEQLEGHRINRWISLGPADARLRAQLFELGAVSEESVTDAGSWRLHVELSRELAERLARQGGASGSVVREQLLSSDREETTETMAG
jgi:GTP-binding protein HflX